MTADETADLIGWLADVAVAHNVGVSALSILNAAIHDRTPATQPADQGDYQRCLALINACPVEEVVDEMLVRLVRPKR